MAIDWRDYVNNAPAPNENPMIPAAPAVDVPPTQVDATPSQMPGYSTPEGGDVSVNPTDVNPSNAGLYAIFNRANPAQKSADRYGRLAGMDMGGRLGALPGIVATYMSGVEQNKADAADAQKQKDAEAYQGSLDAYNKIKDDKETVQKNAQYFNQYVMPMVSNAYMGAFQQAKGAPDAAHQASAAAVQVYNDQNQRMGGTLPPIQSVNFWKDAATVSYIGKDGKQKTGMFKDGNFVDMNGDPVGSDALLLKDAAKVHEDNIKDKAQADKVSSDKARLKLEQDKINAKKRFEGGKDTLGLNEAYISFVRTLPEEEKRTDEDRATIAKMHKRLDMTLANERANSGQPPTGAPAPGAAPAAKPGDSMGLY